MLPIYSTPLYLYFIILKLTGKARCESYRKWVVDCDLSYRFYSGVRMITEMIV